MKLTRTGSQVLIAVTIFTLLGFALGVQELVVLGVAGFAAVGFSLVTVLEAPSMIVDRYAHPNEVERGSPAEVTLGFSPSSSTARPRPFLAIETINESQWVAAMPALIAGETHTFSYALETTQRGNITAGPLVLRRVDLFGLVTAERRVTGIVNVAVRPRRHHIRMLPEGRRRDLEGPTRERSAGTASFHQLREYTPGDDLRLIHWRSTARTGTLVVREMVDTTRPEIVVILDNRHVAVRPDDFEHAVEVAASILEAAEQDNFPYQLHFADGSTDVGPDGMQVGFLDRLTGVSISHSDSLLELADALHARGRSLVYITGELVGADLAVISRISQGFSPVYLISVVAERTAPFVAPPGVKAISCSSADEFVTIWRSMR